MRGLAGGERGQGTGGTACQSGPAGTRRTRGARVGSVRECTSRGGGHLRVAEDAHVGEREQRHDSRKHRLPSGEQGPGRRVSREPPPALRRAAGRGGAGGFWGGGAPGGGGTLRSTAPRRGGPAVVWERATAPPGEGERWRIACAGWGHRPPGLPARQRRLRAPERGEMGVGAGLGVDGGAEAVHRFQEAGRHPPKLWKISEGVLEGAEGVCRGGERGSAASGLGAAW